MGGGAAGASDLVSDASGAGAGFAASGAALTPLGLGEPFLKAAGWGIEDGLRLVGRGGIVQPDQRLAIDVLVQRRKMASHPFHIKARPRSLHGGALPPAGVYQRILREVELPFVGIDQEVAAANHEDSAAALIELIKAPPAGEEAFLLDLLTHRVPPGVDDAAKVKASFLAAVAHGDLAVGLISKAKATELLGTMVGGYNVHPLIELLDDAEVAAPVEHHALTHRHAQPGTAPC